MDTCFLCEWFLMSYQGDYSEVTPGEGAIISCCKGHYCFSNGDLNSGEDWNAIIIKSRTCPDATPRSKT